MQDKNFDDRRGVKFSTYASIRVSSFIIDEIRKYSPVSNDTYEEQNKGATRKMRRSIATKAF